MNRPIPHSAPPLIKARDQAKRQETAQKLQQIQIFNPFIGGVVAVSGRRNLSCLIRALMPPHFRRLGMHKNVGNALSLHD